MKRFMIRILALVGILAIGFLCLSVLIEMNAPNYEERAIEEFGSAEAINAILELYEKIEKNYNDSDFLAFDQGINDYSQTKNVPKNGFQRNFHIGVGNTRRGFRFGVMFWPYTTMKETS